MTAAREAARAEPTELPPGSAALLRRYVDLTRRAVSEVLERATGPYLGELVRDYPERGGKGLRPALLLATCEAYGGSAERALGAAASVELLHNAFLVHDDIEDASPLRRGRPTLHEKHGVGLAMNAGDALAHLALEPVLTDRRLAPTLLRRVLDEVRELIRVTVAGQALELGWRRDAVVDVSASAYLELVGKKTCWYTTIAPLRIGAIVATGDRAPLPALSRLGFLTGAAFQIRDDLINLDPTLDPGKQPYTDVLEGKRTLMLIRLLEVAAPDERAWVVGYLRQDEADRAYADALRVVDLMQRHDCVGWTARFAARIEDAAAEALGPAFAGRPAGPATDLVASLVPYMLSRRT